MNLIKFIDTDKEHLNFIWPVLRRSGYGKSENDLLKAIEVNKSANIVHYAVIGLNILGTEKSLSILKQTIYYSKEDVKTTSVTAIGNIARGNETEFYASLLDNPKFRDKAYPMAVIWEVGDDRAVDAVIRHANKALEHKVRWLKEPEDLGYIIDYLKRYAHGGEADEVIERLERRVEETKYQAVYKPS